MTLHRSRDDVIHIRDLEPEQARLEYKATMTTLNEYMNHMEGKKHLDHSIVADILEPKVKSVAFILELLANRHEPGPDWALMVSNIQQKWLDFKLWHATQ